MPAVAFIHTPNHTFKEPFMTELTDHDLLAAFESCTLPTSEFSHERHLRIAWHYLATAPLGIAAEQFKAALQRYAAAHGLPYLYHETITWAYMVLLGELRASIGEPDAPFDAALARCPGLQRHRGGPLFDLYTQEELDRPGSRSAFRLPRRPTV
jgi:hypothetical protein